MILALHAETNDQKERAIEKKNLNDIFKDTIWMNAAFERTSPRTQVQNERPNHSTIYEAERHRADFERLCSNHTIKQYEAHVDRMRQEFPEIPQIKFCQESNTDILNSALGSG